MWPLLLFSIIFQYMDLILIHGDAIITCLDNLSTEDDTLQPKVKNYYLPLFLLLTFTVKLGVELINNPKNHDQSTVALVWHDRDFQQEKLLATFSRLKCFIEPRSGMLAFFWQINVSSVDHHLQYADCFETPYAVETTTAALTLIFEVMSIPLGPLFCDMNECVWVQSVFGSHLVDGMHLGSGVAKVNICEINFSTKLNRKADFVI